MKYNYLDNIEIKESFNSINEAKSFLELGNVYERIKAINTLIHDIDPKQFYEELWNVFLSDIDKNVRIFAVIGCIACKPNKCFEIFAYCYNEQEKIIKEHGQYGRGVFPLVMGIPASILSFYKTVLFYLGRYIGKHGKEFENKLKLKQVKKNA